MITLKKPKDYDYQKFNYFSFLRKNGINNAETVKTLNGKTLHVELKDGTNKIVNIE